MGLFSLIKSNKRSRQLTCDWCGKEIEACAHKKHLNGKTFCFCSESCKKNFRKSGKGKGVYNRCPTCPMAPKSWH